MHNYRILPSMFCILLLALPMQQAVAQQAAGQDTEVETLEEVVVLGSRVPTRSAHDSPVPIDVIEAKDMRNYGVRDMDSLLRATVPSYNVNQQPIGDAATLVRPANLRGLPPDSTLILVNGKRRHRSSVISLLGGGISDGAHAADLAAIPAIALKRVEVLRDGAAAQYGSDAVAGVINFQLKDAPDSGTVETRWGQFYLGDGDSRSIAGNIGVPLQLPFVQSGFANFSFEYGASDPTVRSVQREGAQKLIDAGNTHVRQPYAQVWGAPEFHYDYKFFGNLGLKLNSKAEIYGWGNYAQRKIEGGFYYRNPNTRSGVFDDGHYLGDPDKPMRDDFDKDDYRDQEHPNYEAYEINEENYGALSPDDPRKQMIDKLLKDKKKIDDALDDKFSDDDDSTYRRIKVANLDPSQGECPLVPANKAADYSDVNLPDHCFMFNERFPGGFTPTFGATVSDWSGAVGIRGDLSSDNFWLDDWHYDLSAVFGHHSADYFMTNTINPQLAYDEVKIQTNYQPGADIERDRVFNLDLSRALQTTMLPSPLNIGLGLEYRIEEYEIEAGEENSWAIDNRYQNDDNLDDLSEQGFGVGSNGFPGRPTRIAGKNNRGSYAAYLDLETNVSKDLLVGLAGRYEEYETFGDTLNGKVDTRWQATSNMALRGSLSTGFRAPTVGQTNLINVTTAFVSGRLADRLTLPPTHASGVPQKYGAQQLKPETSVNLSAGTVMDFGNLSVTVDYYRMDVQDRISLGSNQDLDDEDQAALEQHGFIGSTSVKFFTNAFDTVTQGIDLVATYPVKMGDWTSLWTLAGNWNDTRVTNRDSPRIVKGAKVQIINNQRVTELEQLLPNFRLTLTGDHRQGPWRVLGRLHYYDGFTEFTTDDPDNRIDASSRMLMDLEGSYTWKSGLTVAAGAQNLFDAVPDRTNGVAGTKYPEYAPFGFNGGYYYLRALYAF